MPNCIVLGCPHKCGKKDKFPEVIMHAFPRSMDRIKSWLLRTGQRFEDLDGLAQRIYDGKKTSAHRLCSAHFTIDSYIVNKTNRILRPDALPSIFPPLEDYHSRKQARKQKKNKDSKQLSNSLPHLLWQESSREDDWTKTEYLFQGAETQTDLSCFDTTDLQEYHRSLSDTEFQQLLHDHPHVFEHPIVDAPQSLLTRLKEERVQLPCAELENGVLHESQEHPKLLTSMKSEHIDEHLIDQHEDSIRHIVITSPKEEVNHLMFPDLNDQTNSRVTDPNLFEIEEMPKCIVKDCLQNAGSTPGVTLHMFPKDLATIKKWLVQTNQDFDDIELFAMGILHGKTDVFRICSAHFAPECYTLVGSQKVLLGGAIPTIVPERDKLSNTMETVGKPVFQNVYLPISLWTNSVSVISNIAPWGVNQLINPSMKINQDSNILVNELEVNVSMSAAANKPKEKPSECENPPTNFGRCHHRNFDLPDAMLHEQLNSDTKTVSRFPDLSTKNEVKAVQCPEYENNVDGEMWKVLHDHFYKVQYGKKYQDLNRCSSMKECISKDDFSSYSESTHLENELFSMLQYIVSAFTINRNKDLKTARILNQALEVVSLITGEEWVVANKNFIHKGVQQQSGEFPVKCDDVAVFFTLDEWAYIDQHKEDYEDFVTDNIPISRTWEVPEHWDSDPITEDDEDDDMEDYPEKISSSEWEPDSERESEDCYDGGKEPSKSPNRLSSADEDQITHKCDESFSDTEALGTHKITHMEKCENCEELFSSKAEVIKHQAENHAVKRFACTICDIQYNYKSQFIIHQRTHTGEKPFHCEDCGAEFAHKSSLIVHQRRHIKGKTFKCKNCERRFDKRSEMVRHEKVHSKKKQYKCQKCGKTFVQKAACERHKWEHDDD